MNAEWFASRLKELREGKGLSRQQLADLAGMKTGGIRNLEQGVRKPSWESVVALCQALGVGCDAFMQEPADTSPGKPGRPKKATELDAGSAESGDTTGEAAGATEASKSVERSAARPTKRKGQSGAGKGKRKKGTQ